MYICSKYSIMKLTIILSGILLFGLISKAWQAPAQNYEAIKTDASYYFYHSGSNDLIAMKIDSVAVSGNDILYFNFPQIRPTENSFCYTPDGASWLGDPVIEKPGGIFLFKTVDQTYGNQTDTLVIKTQAALNETWKFSGFPFTNDHVEAQVSSVENMTFLGLTDSVKIITLTRRDASGILVSDAINGEQIRLSKNYGLIRLPKFDDFNDYRRFYEITGKTNPSTGYTNPDLNTIFDFEVGDEIHTHYYSNWFNYSASTEIWTIKRVTGKSISPTNNWKSYKYDICFLKILKSAPEWVPEHETGHQSADDTIFLNSEFAVELAKEPNQTYLDPGSKWIMGTTAFLKLQRTAKYLNYNNPFASSSPEDSCWSLVMVDGGCDPYYITGLGGPYYDCPSNVYWYNYIQEIVYYQKGSETWGTPLNCDSLLQVGIDDIPATQKVNIYPNPTAGQVTVSIPVTVEIPCEIQVSDFSGRIIHRYSISQKIQSLNMSGLPSGLYYFTIQSANGMIFSGKIIRQ